MVNFSSLKLASLYFRSEELNGNFLIRIMEMSIQDMSTDSSAKKHMCSVFVFVSLCLECVCVLMCVVLSVFVFVFLRCRER